MSAATLTSADPDFFAQALVNFSANGQYPDNIDSLAAVFTSPALEKALGELGKARSELEGEIRSISRTSAPDVDQWIQHAKTLRAEIDTSRALARSIQQLADQGDLFQQDIKNHEAQIAFLEKEQIYNRQLHDALRGMEKVHLLLNEVPMFTGRNRIVDALQALAAAASAKRDIPALPSGRPLIMLEERYMKLQGAVHDSFIEQWKFLVNVDVENHTVTIRHEHQADGGLDLDLVFAAMEAFNETEKLMKELAEELKHAIFAPRFKLTQGELPLFEFDQNSVRLAGSHRNCDIKHVILDLEKLIIFLSSRLPVEVLQQLSVTCASFISDHMRRTWLDVAVPVRLGEEMTEFRRTMGLILQLVETMDNVNWAGSKEFKEWVDGCAKIWLGKRKEHSLDWVRNHVALGIGTKRRVERVEREVVKEGEMVDGADWDANWDDEKKTRDEGDDFDAWGFGDDVTEVPPDISQSSPKDSAPLALAEHHGEKMVTLSEKYTISSMPGHVITTITEIIEDALTLSDPANESNPITPAAAGLFAVPTLVLAMYRAVAPYHYKSHVTGGGKMFQYNDAMWLSTELQNVLEDWRKRPKISPRAFGKIKFDAEIETLQRWGKRAYAEELQEQKTILKDLMGGTYNFLDASGREPNVSGGWGFDEDNGAEESSGGELGKTIDTVVAKIRAITTTWKRILGKSAWAQASAALLSVVARKIVADVQDRDSLGSEECEHIATLIDKVLRLDDLFIPLNLEAEESIYEPSFGDVGSAAPTPPSPTMSAPSPHTSPTRSAPITAQRISDFDSSASFPAPDDARPPINSAFAFLRNRHLTRAQKEDLVHERIGAGEAVPLTIAYAGTDWLRLQYAKEILAGRLTDIQFLWFESELALAFDAEEVVGWIERCFERTRRRGEVVAGIRRGKKVVLAE